MTINDRIKFYVKSKGLIQRDFARKIGLTGGAVSNWEVGTREPQPRTLIKILEVYPDINARWLLFGTGSMNETEIYAQAQESAGSYTIQSGSLPKKMYDDLYTKWQEEVLFLRNQIETLNRIIITKL